MTFNSQRCVDIKPPPQALIDALAAFEQRSKEVNENASNTGRAAFKGVKREVDHHSDNQLSGKCVFRAPEDRASYLLDARPKS